MKAAVRSFRTIFWCQPLNIPPICSNYLGTGQIGCPLDEPRNLLHSSIVRRVRMRPKPFTSAPGILLQRPCTAAVQRGVSEERGLVRQCLAGDPQAVRRLVETFQGLVFGLCYRMTRHREDAEDITQEVLLRAIRSLKSWDERRPLRPWILAIAANRCRTYLLQQSQRPRATEYLTDVADSRRPDHDRELADELELAMEDLRPDYRLVVIMYHDQELPYAEISAAIGRPIGTVKTWLHRARAEMARRLARRSILCGVTRHT
jgi:RNA polymerase sigma-70 factor (ECF subfamily)